MEKMTSKRRKRPATWRKGPSKEGKSTIQEFIFKGEGRAPLLAPPPGSPMSKSDNKMNTIFENYSAHNYIKIHFRMHPIALFHKKKIGRAYP